MSVTTKVTDFVKNVFPERQIYHRTGGTVRYFTVSPTQQIILSSAAAAIVLWSLFATWNTLVNSNSPQSTLASGEAVRLERMVNEYRANSQLASSQLAQRTTAYHDATIENEKRLTALASMVTALKTGGELELSALRGDSASLLVTASIDQADPRQPQRRERLQDSLTVAAVTNKAASELNQTQQVILDNIEDIAVDRAESARGVLTLTKVGAGRITSGKNIGGPDVPLSSMLSADDYDTPEDFAFIKRVAQVASRLEEARYFEGLVDNLPLSTPIGIPWRKTSNYGFRIHPITKRQGYHNGVDLGAGWNAPIVAAGPGKVIYAGYRGGYGKVVDIDHGQGFVSRYAHLRRIIAKRGQTVAIGDKIGTMGSSGNSTGPHLHYEVLFHGKFYDPYNFIKAGKHVHEN